MKKIKLLYFVDRVGRGGGIQTLLYNWVSRIDKKQFEISLLVLDDGNDYPFEKEFIKMGCKLYKLKGVWIKKPGDFHKMKVAINLFFLNNHDFDIIHYHASSKNFLILKYAMKYGIKTRIAHSHNTNFISVNKVKIVAGNILKRKVKKYANKYFACSNEAGYWLFGKKICQSSNFKIIHNCVDYDAFKYNETKRKSIRKKYGIKDDEILFGHIGRFVEQKNHEFLIKVFKEFVKNNNTAKLILIGDGVLRDKITKEVEELSLNDRVIFTGLVNNVSEFLNAIDIFLMPSLYEGLPVTLIEAQCNGLKCIISNTISKESDISNSLIFLPIDDEKLWVDKMNNISKSRNDNYELIKKNNYLLDDTINELQTFYKKNKY